MQSQRKIYERKERGSITSFESERKRRAEKWRTSFFELKGFDPKINRRLCVFSFSAMFAKFLRLSEEFDVLMLLWFCIGVVCDDDWMILVRIERIRTFFVLNCVSGKFQLGFVFTDSSIFLLLLSNPLLVIAFGLNCEKRDQYSSMMMISKEINWELFEFWRRFTELAWLFVSFCW